jgi:alkaline phosphatase D
MTDEKNMALMLLNRRNVLQTGLFGIAAMSSPGGAAIMAAKGFTHGVASGEPTSGSILLWTRFVGGDGGTKLRAEICEDATFKRIVAGGDVMATPAQDYTAKIVLKGLKPAHRYHYRFVSPDGSISDIGRTKTLPRGKTSSCTLAVFSCSNMPFGWFNAYGHAAARDDIDLAIFLGDYFYEYPVGNYPSSKQAMPERIIQPVNETISLADYRLRYASYRTDADLQRLHAAFPCIAMWDDHEFTNDAWKDGAENHQPNEGDWKVRKAAAEKAWREWMPVSDNVGETRWNRYSVGDLAVIHLTESRIGARSQQLSFAGMTGSPDELAKRFTEFRDGPWSDTSRTMLGAPQEKWLADGFGANKTPWNIWAQQTIVGTIRQPEAVTGWISPTAPSFVQDRVKRGAAAAKAGLPANLDNWDGYPAARERTLKAAQAANADLIVLTGDSHNAWAFDLPSGGKPAGVELGGQSVTSPGYESSFTSTPPKDVAAALMATNNQLKWADTSQRGYMTVEVTPAKVTSNWHFLATVRQKSTVLSGTHSMVTLRGKRVFES